MQQLFLILSDKKMLGLFLLFFIGLFNFFGIINTPALVIGLIDHGIEIVTNPAEMNVHIGEIESKKETSWSGLKFEGYTITTKVYNTGRSGFATFKCQVYSEDEKYIKHKEQVLELGRNDNQPLVFEFKPDELLEGDYQFNIIIIRQDAQS